MSPSSSIKQRPTEQPTIALAICIAIGWVALHAFPVRAENSDALVASGWQRFTFLDAASEPVPGVVVLGIATATPSSARQAGAHELRDQTSKLTIDQRGKRYIPFVSTAKPGTEVFFPNSDDTRHHVYSFSSGNTFERKLYRANEAEPVVFANPGVVALGCNIHDNMQAFVLVSPDRVLAVTDESGTADVQLSGGSTAMLRIWHPSLATTADTTEVTPDRDGVVRLDFYWQDPQSPKSTGELESLLKKFSDGSS